MRLSTYNFATRRETPQDADSANAALLARGRFIERGMTGVYNFLPLGWKVIENIMSVVRQRMNETGAYEGKFATLQEKSIWEKTGRWDTARDIMYQFQDHSGRDTGLGFTHEEVIVDILGRQPLSYTDFPYKLYQFQTKFRHEPRAKSGLLRGREFLMKDLYSAHATEADFKAYYAEVLKAYHKAFRDLDIAAVETLASGGVFSANFSHEFQAISPVGEDEIYVCAQCKQAINREIIDEVNRICPECESTDFTVEHAIEVGNTFNLGTYYSEKMEVLFADADGARKPFWFGSYGIGISRAMGAIVELHHDEKGIMWPKRVAPAQVHLVGLHERANDTYHSLENAGITVLYDDRPLSAGEKFADADLLGMPIRLTIGHKTPDGLVEWKERASDSGENVTVGEAINRLKEE